MTRLRSRGRWCRHKKPGNVRYVLGFSVAAIVIVFAIIWLVYFG
jgi:hypothetical protein